MKPKKDLRRKRSFWRSTERCTHDNRQQQRSRQC